MRQLEGTPSEIIVVDNGSDDATTAFLEPRGILVEHSAEPLSFAAAVNRGIRRAAYSHVLLLNNDMLLEPGFFAPLLSAFGQVPNLFCATAQILFPPGVRREETGKAVMRQEQPADFPVHCLDPLPGEDLSYVFYGSGGCSLFDTAKLRALGCVSEAFVPAYVEDLDLGYRGWQRGWPTVFVAAAKVVHKHRATTSRYYTEQELERVLELNYLRFLSTAVADARVFRRLWRQAIYRLHIRACLGHPAAQQALARAGGIALTAASPPPPVYSEEHFLALGTGDVAVFPGGLPRRQKPVVLVASPWAPDPWAQDGAARVYHLMRRAARDYDQVLVAFQSSLATPSSALLAICNEVVFVARPSGNPQDEQYDSLAFRAALEQTVRKWRPAIAQLEEAQMAHYADACGTARKVLVEHELQIGSARRDVDGVVTTSVKEGGRRAVVIPNGVDPDHFQPSSDKPESRRLLWIGSFQQVTDIEALNLFLREVWPLMQDLNPRLHVIAGDRHEDFLRLYESRVRLPELPAGVEMEGFDGDLRPAYSRAEVVVAGTSIRILEAMAMAKAVVTTPAGIGGLDLRNGQDLLVTSNAAGMARAIGELITNPALRGRLEQTARHTAARNWNWDQSAARQRALYQAMMPDSL
jgi:GT2 family glycosyltransferase